MAVIGILSQTLMNRRVHTAREGAPDMELITAPGPWIKTEAIELHCLLKEQ